MAARFNVDPFFRSYVTLLTRLNLEKLVNIFEGEEITMQTLRMSTATELKGILKISFGSAKLITEEVARVNAADRQHLQELMHLKNTKKEKQKKKEATRVGQERNGVEKVEEDVGEPSTYLPEEYPSNSFMETFSCGKCEDKFISKESLEQHEKEEHKKKEATCIFCGFFWKQEDSS